MRENTNLFDDTPSTTWVLIADNEQAEIRSCVKTTRIAGIVGANKHNFCHEKTEYELVPEPDGILRSETIDDYQIGHDKRGTSSSSVSPTRNTYEPEGDIKKELKRRYAKSVANKLYHAAIENSFDRLILVAPPRLMSELKEYLPSDVQERVIAELPKDLAHCTNQELIARLQDVLTEVRIH